MINLTLDEAKKIAAEGDYKDTNRGASDSEEYQQTHLYAGINRG